MVKFRTLFALAAVSFVCGLGVQISLADDASGWPGP